jgi:ankyrin repeat protein
MINNIDAKNRQAKTALMLGQPIDDSSITKTLINKGANLFIKDNSGMEAIHYAAIMNKY